MPPLPKKVAAQQRCHGFGLHLAIAMAWAGSASVAINHRISRDLFSEGRVICTTSIGVLRRKLRTTTFAARHGRKEGNRGMNVTTRQVYYFEDLEVGMEASFAKTVTAADIVAFAEVTGDKNPVHLDAAYAARTIFKEPIAHGMLTAGYISAVFGMELPGPGAIYVSQTLNFRGRQGRRPGRRQGAGDGALSRQAPRPLRKHLHGRRQGRAGRRGGADGSDPPHDQGGLRHTQPQVASVSSLSPDGRRGKPWCGQAHRVR
jgi:hypothetical protein